MCADLAGMVATVTLLLLH